MKVSYELEQGYIDVWNEESEEWDRYIKVNKKSVVEEEKKIPEKLKKKSIYTREPNGFEHPDTELSSKEEMFDKINEIIDYLESKGDE